MCAVSSVMMLGLAVTTGLVPSIMVRLLIE